MALPLVAAEVVTQIKKKASSLKNAVYSNSYANKKQLMAVVCEVLKYHEVIEDVLGHCDLKKTDKRFKTKENLAVVVLHKYMFGKGLNGCYTQFKKVVEKQRVSINAAIARVKVRRKITDLCQAADIDDDCKAQLPRYVRINTLKATQEKAITALSQSGFTRIDSYDTDSKGKWLTIDTDIPNLLILPVRTDLHDNKLVTDGRLILQDKASCLPAHILSPPPGSHVIDACAAPGNKTTHLAALMANSGSITAFELNKKRSKTLGLMLKKAGVTCSSVVTGDFTHCKESEFKDVEYILVDPSCSGSGIASRMNQLTDDDESKSEERLSKLASFQSVILKKALSFPNVKRVVYSTCSIHDIENEMVVRDVLSQVGDKFSLQDVMPSWTNRGRDLGGDFPIGKRCIRASPTADNTIGFFVALFARQDK